MPLQNPRSSNIPSNVSRICGIVDAVPFVANCQTPAIPRTNGTMKLSVNVTSQPSASGCLLFRCVVARIAGFYILIMDFIIKNKWINELHLKGNKLMLYAMIHAYCVRYGEYSKGILYLSKCLGINKSTVIDCLKWLCEKGLLIKSVQPVAEPDVYKISIL